MLFCFYVLHAKIFLVGGTISYRPGVYLGRARARDQTVFVVYSYSDDDFELYQDRSEEFSSSA